MLNLPFWEKSTLEAYICIKPTNDAWFFPSTTRNSVKRRRKSCGNFFFVGFKLMLIVCIQFRKNVEAFFFPSFSPYLLSRKFNCAKQTAKVFKLQIMFFLRKYFLLISTTTCFVCLKIIFNTLTWGEKAYNETT